MVCVYDGVMVVSFVISRSPAIREVGEKEEGSVILRPVFVCFELCCGSPPSILFIVVVVVVLLHFFTCLAFT